jgi:hypothetical protein
VPVSPDSAKARDSGHDTRGRGILTRQVAASIGPGAP